MACAPRQPTQCSSSTTTATTLGSLEWPRPLSTYWRTSNTSVTAMALILTTSFGTRECTSWQNRDVLRSIGQTKGRSVRSQAKVIGWWALSMLDLGRLAPISCVALAQRGHPRTHFRLYNRIISGGHVNGLARRVALVRRGPSEIAPPGVLASCALVAGARYAERYTVGQLLD